MNVYIVGSGKLAKAILSAEISLDTCEILKWEPQYGTPNEKAILVHAGSGRQLTACVDFCRRTDSILVELSTGLETETMTPDFTLIVCPNTSILLLKVLNIIDRFGHYFQNDKVSITESHQASKQSEPGTAFAFARSLKVPVDQIKSVRDTQTQRNELDIPDAFLDRHAYHKIVIQDGLDEVTIETKVFGHDSYVSGVKKIIDAVLKRPFEKRRYTVLELIEKSVL